MFDIYTCDAELFDKFKQQYELRDPRNYDEAYLPIIQVANTHPAICSVPPKRKHVDSVDQRDEVLCVTVGNESGARFLHSLYMVCAANLSAHLYGHLNNADTFQLAIQPLVLTDEEQEKDTRDQMPNWCFTLSFYAENDEQRDETLGKIRLTAVELMGNPDLYAI